MKMKKTMALLLSVLLCLCLLTGCGGSSKAADTANMMAMPEAAEAPAAAAGTNGALEQEMGMPQDNTLPENRKWIITVYMNAETENLDEALPALLEQVKSFDGYVEDQSEHNGSAYAARRYRSASWTIRIPAEQVDAFTQNVSQVANVISREKDLEDVTLQYVDTENRVKALETEEKRLLELLAEAETMADLLEIEARLTDVRYELEQYASQLRLYDNKIDYATIHLDIQEVQEYTPVEEPTVWERISGGFVDNLKGLGTGLLNILVWIIACSPTLLVAGLVTFALVKLIRKLGKKRTPREKKSPYAEPPKNPENK